MPCCDWNDFVLAFNAAFKRKSASPLLIDWKLAKRDWKRHHCTGGEAAFMQLRTLAEECEYNYCVPEPRKRRDDDDGGGGVLVAA